MKTPYFRKALLPALFLSIALLFNGCKKSTTTPTTTTSTSPTVATTALIINLTATTAQSGGNITDAGTSAVTAAGVCYSATNKTPTTNDAKVVQDLTTLSLLPADFSVALTGLTAGTTYYARAYASNSSGTAYGAVVQFTTATALSGLVTTVSTLAGDGTAGYYNGIGAVAKFNNPGGIAVDAAGNIYVADSFNNRIRRVTSDGTVSAFAGKGTLGYTEGAAADAEFYGPQGVAADGAGNIYVADLGNNVIRKITAGGVVSTFAGSGTAGFVNATGTSAQFNNPAGLAIDASGNIYVADRGNNAIRKITSAGVVTTLAGFKTGGYVNATGTAAAFDTPNGVAVDASGNVYVADQGNSAIRKITPAGVVTTVAGGPAQATLLNFPSALALDSQGNIFIADEGGRIIECTNANILYILAGTLNTTGLTNGDGATALFSNPQGIAIDASGNIYVADQDNNCIRKLVVVKKP